MMIAARQKVELHEKSAREQNKDSEESVEVTEGVNMEKSLPYPTSQGLDSQLSDELKTKITRIVEANCAVEDIRTSKSKLLVETGKKSAPKSLRNGVLDFCGYNLGYGGVLHVLNEIHDWDSSHIVKMDFSGCALEERGMNVVYKIVKLCKNVKELNLSRNNLGRSGITWVARLMQSTAISCLKLAHNGLNGKDMEVFLAALPDSDAIVTLDLSYNILGPYVGELITKYLPVSSVQCLNLGHNEIGSEGVRNMVEGLQENDSLREIDLSWNYLYDKGMSAIADVILTAPLLRRIHLNGNFITEVGAQPIAQGLRENSTLEILNLAQNFIRSQGACALVRAVRSNMGSKLRLLDINGTLVSNEFMVMYRRIQMDKEGFEVIGFCAIGGEGNGFRRRKSSKFQ